MNMRVIAAIVAAAISTFLLRAEDVTRYYLKVNDFTELKVVDDVNVTYRCSPDSAGHVMFYATPDQASAFIFQPDGMKLDIQVSTETPREARSLPTVTVYSSFLSRVENDGKGHLTVDNVAPGPKFKCVLVGNGRITARGLKFNTVEAALNTGNGEIVVTGQAEIAKLSSTGTGHIQADELKVREAKCRILGTGSIGINATETLTVSGMGTGTVYYLGTPTVKNRTLGVKTEPLGAATGAR